MNLQISLNELKSSISGDLFLDKGSKISYATDASVYYEEPLGVCIPKTLDDIHKCILFASESNCSLIPRAAGTSLAGQVVGQGLVVDISKHFGKIEALNVQEQWVQVQPGVILDELNRYLAERNLFFGPEASTGNRCMIGGMVGNNACGLHAVVYGTTRDHLLEVSGYLSDGSFVNFKPLSTSEFEAKCEGDSLENKIYRQLRNLLSKSDHQKEIFSNYPEPRLIRRNNGYALDQLLYSEYFGYGDKKINVSKLIAGSEGTLMFITSIKLSLVRLPAKEKALVCAHFNSINDALKANIVALKNPVTAVELMDDIILNASRKNISQEKNRFFIQGNPKAILMIEIVDETRQGLDSSVKKLIADLEFSGLTYHFPVLYGNDTQKAWNLRKAGLGIMANIAGDTKSITVIEDTAVHPDVLPEYIADFTNIMEGYGEACVYHAHAGTGEIHLRPRLNLKKETDVETFESIAWDIAKLVKKYRGSLSGEHGDGRLRGEFIPFMLGDKVYDLLVQIKNNWDANHIFNPGKIIETPPMRSNLRYNLGETPVLNTYFDFSDKLGIVRASESCNGSGDCRKLYTAGGTMCPSYMATKDERHVTRSRANVLRHFLVDKNDANPFNHQEIYDALDLCLSCKACKSECPSSVDVAKMKAEFLQHYYDANGVPLRTRLIANIGLLNEFGSKLPALSNYFLSNSITSFLIKSIAGISKQRTLPKITSLKNNFTADFEIENKKANKGKVLILIDEFTQFNDSDLAVKCARLLQKLGYEVGIIKDIKTGRAYYSKGLLKKAKKLAVENIKSLHDQVSNDIPLLGIEPSALLCFRDEYPEIVGDKYKSMALEVKANAFLVEEFLASQMDKGFLEQSQFTVKSKDIKLHGHCQQKAIASTDPVKRVLSFPLNYHIAEIPSGCCGMAGSFGYEKEHYAISMQIGELVLFPAVREANGATIAAPGTSCRHQIFDGTGAKALHPIEILFDALI